MHMIRSATCCPSRDIPPLSALGMLFFPALPGAFERKDLLDCIEIACHGGDVACFLHSCEERLGELELLRVEVEIADLEVGPPVRRLELFRLLEEDQSLRRALHARERMADVHVEFVVSASRDKWFQNPVHLRTVTGHA